MKEFYNKNKSAILKLLPPTIAMIWFFGIAIGKTYVDATSAFLLVFSILWCIFWAAKYLGNSED